MGGLREPVAEIRLIPCFYDVFLPKWQTRDIHGENGTISVTALSLFTINTVHWLGNG